jgi:hypothetical protein
VNLNSILIGTDDLGRLTGYYTKLFGEPAWIPRRNDRDSVGARNH